MIQLGSTEQWVSVIETQVPDILALVIETWEALPSPAGNELEDPISETLCRSLRQSRTRCDLPFRIDTQLVELDPAAGQDQGRMDIVFSPPAPREDIYFCLECKRLNVRGENGIRPFFVEYVRFGMFRFVRGQYANSVRHGGMLAFVLDGDAVGAIAGVEINIRNLSSDLGMDNSAALSASTVRPTDARIRETRHRRGQHADPFIIHHLFMAGDPNTPLRPIPAPTGAKTPKPKFKTTFRASRNKRSGQAPLNNQAVNADEHDNSTFGPSLGVGRE